MSTTLVVPTYQERENIEQFLRSARKAVPEAHIVVCDDNSPDGTGDLADELALELGDIEVLHRPGKEGLGAAYRHGFRHALDSGAEIVIQMDVDLSHDPTVLPTMLATLAAGADVVVGSRYVPGGDTPDWSLHRKLLSKYGNIYARRMLRLRMRDSTAGFRAYTAEILERIKFDTTRANGYGFQVETGFRLSDAGAKITEVPIIFRDRVHGISKMSVRIMAENMALFTWWGLCLRAPGLTSRFRATSMGRYLEGRTTPSV